MMKTLECMTWYEENIGEIYQKRRLYGSTDSKIYLINEKHVLKAETFDTEAVVDWYTYNRNSGPKLLYSDSSFFLYEYCENDGQITSELLIEFLDKYRPRITALDETYYRALSDLYRKQCEAFDVLELKLKIPNVFKGYFLHGDLGLHNMIVSEKKVIFIDPDPVSGLLEQDILQFYFSSPKVMELLLEETIQGYCDAKIYDFLYPIMLLDRADRSKRHHPQDLSFYLERYEKFVKLK